MARDLGSDGTAGAPDSNRDNDHKPDNYSFGGETSALEEYLLDKVEKYGNGDGGTVIKELYREIIRPGIIGLSQAIGDQLTQHEQP